MGWGGQSGEMDMGGQRGQMDMGAESEMGRGSVGCLAASKAS